MPTCPACRKGFPSGPGAPTTCPEDGAVLDDENARTELGLVSWMGGGGSFPGFGYGGQAGLATAPAPLSIVPASEVSDPLIGSTLAGRFKVLARIGQGGMGVVYRATHTVIGREVALKVLHERHADRPEVAARLVNEARLASAIHNEHIVDIFDSGLTADGRTFVVMELLEGESLSALIRREGALPEPRALEIVRQMADALGAAHTRGIIHRDVKPENIFLCTQDGAEFVKVLDFGISKAVRGGDLDGDQRLTHTGMVLGTPLYMSPEQARGEEAIDHRIDVYALGVIFYECLTGEVPFRGSNYLGIISDVLSRVPPPPREVRPDLRISVGAEQVCMRAMARDRASRYASMEDVRSDLEGLIAGRPLVAAAAASAAAAAATEARIAAAPRRALLYGSLLAIVLAVAAVTSIATRRAPARAEAAPLPGPASTPTAGLALPSSSLVAASSPAPAPTPPSPTVSVLVRTTPPGAEILNGARRLGVAPQVISLARSDHPLRLRFRLEGYEEGATDVVPTTDGEHVDVELAALPSPTRTHHSPPRRPIAPSPAQDMPPVSNWEDLGGKAPRPSPRNP